MPSAPCTNNRRIDYFGKSAPYYDFALDLLTLLESPSIPPCPALGRDRLPAGRQGVGRQVCLEWWKYLQAQEHQLLIEGRVKALPFQTGFTLFHPRMDDCNIRV